MVRGRRGLRKPCTDIGLEVGLKKMHIDIKLEDGLSSVQSGFDKVVRIVGGEKTSYFCAEDYISLYTTIYNMSIQKPPHYYSVELYEKFREIIENYIRTEVLPSFTQKHDVYLLGELVMRWSNHLIMVKWLSHFFIYLDRYYIPRNKLQTLNNVGLGCFHELVYSAIHSRVKDAVLTLIYQERDGEKFDRSLLKKTTEFFLAIGEETMEYYEKDLEAAILKDSADYYAQIASNHILEDSCPDYLLMADECLKVEDDMASNFLHPSTKPKLIEKVQHELLFKYERQLLEKEETGLHVMLRDGKVEELKRVYELFHRIDGGLETVTSIFKQHIVTDGLALIKQAEDIACNKQENNKDSAGPREMVFIKKVIELHDEHIGYVRICFKDNNKLLMTLREAFKVFCNKVIADMSTSELLAGLADNILKKGGRHEKSSEEDIEEMFDKIVQLLAYIDDKDLFAEFYRKKLARRLLFNRSANDDHERCILFKLKQQNGASFTLKMEGMLTDMALAKENQVTFLNHLEINPSDHPGIDLAVNVLNYGFWPPYKPSDLHLPSELASCVKSFKKFYENKNKSRKLSWISSLGTCTVIGKFDAKPIELIVTTHQAATLVLFNATERLSYQEIMEQLNLPGDEVIRLLYSLSCTRYKIINKEPDTKSISKNDIFVFNSKFTDRMRRIQISIPPLDEKKKVVEEVGKDRRYHIDAALVRIMKCRKVMNYQELVGECITQLSHRFKPDLNLIKRRIEDLIQRDFLERDEKQPNIFKYIA